VVGAHSLPPESSLASISVTRDEPHDSSLGTQAPATANDSEVTQTGWDPIVENEQLRPAPARAPAQRADSTAAIFDGDINPANPPHVGGFPERIDDTTPTHPTSADSSTIHDSATYDVGSSAPTANDPTSSVPHNDSLDVANTLPLAPSDVDPRLPPGFIPTSISSTTPVVAAVAPVPPPPILYPQSPPAVIAPPPELTPQLIAKIQRHCKFAVSALDYEDGDTARKELRAALAMLGG
jgi:vacuolar protein sorting-associated protein VTA1